MILFTNDNILFILGSVFVVITVISLIELSYVVCVLERKVGATEHRLHSTEHRLQQYMTHQDTLIRQLEDTRIEMLSNQCDHLAKTRLMRREFRVLLRKCSNTNEQDQSA